MEEPEKRDEEMKLPDKPWHMPTDGETVPSTPLAPKKTMADGTVARVEDDMPPISLETPRKTQENEENGKLLLNMEYVMDYDQVYSSLVLLDERLKRFRFFNTAIMVFLAVFCLYAYIVSTNISYLLMMVLCAGFVPLLTILPARRRRKTAANVAGKGRFKVKLYQDGRIDVPGKGIVFIKNDMRALSYENDLILMLDMSARKSFCIPKAYLTEEEIAAIRKVFRENSRYREIKRKEQKNA